jgi:peptidoglycan L-alanyl-D-glutamate endopeptidase CwlK
MLLLLACVSSPSPEPRPEAPAQRPLAAAPVPTPPVATPIIDSAMTRAQAMDGLAPDCPPALAAAQALLEVRYTSMDGAEHQGQLVVHSAYADDVQAVFAEIERTNFPLRSVIPISDPRFRKDERWDDDLSMAADNTSSFNYRQKTGGGSLSLHACGAAIDVNPRLNPYIKPRADGTLFVAPPGATWDVMVPGTLTLDHPITQAFLARGFRWGGQFQSLKDYQHFEKDCPK